MLRSEKVKSIVENEFLYFVLADAANLKFNDYKLHISLSKEAYQTHKMRLTKILMEALKDGAINQFKYIETDIVDREIAKQQAFLDNLRKHYVSNPRVPVSQRTTPALYAEFFASLPAGFEPHKIPTFLSETDIQNILNQLAGSIESRKRFENNGQITIYLPEKPDHAAVLSLVVKLNDYLVKNKAAAGQMFAVQSPLNDYVSMRTEYLASDKKRQRRINAHEHVNMTPVAEQLRKEQEASNLYKALSLPLNFAAHVAAIEKEAKALPEDSVAREAAEELYQTLNTVYRQEILGKQNVEQFAKLCNGTINKARKSELVNYPTFKKILINFGLFIAGLGVLFLAYRAYQYKNNANHFWYAPMSSLSSKADELKQKVALVTR